MLGVVKYDVFDNIIKKGWYDDINEKDNDGWTVLMHCCKYLEADRKLKLLKEIGADFNIKGNKGETPLSISIACENDIAVNFLLDNFDYKNITKLRNNYIIDFENYLLETDNINIKNRLLIEISKLRDNSLLEVCRYKDTQYIQNFINNSLYSDINQTDNNGKNAFYYLLDNTNDLETFISLETAGCDLYKRTKKNESLFQYAVANNSKDIVTYLLEKNKFDINESNNDSIFPLCSAIENSKSLELIKILEKAGANFYNKKIDGKSLLHLACEYECIDIVNYFLSKKFFDIEDRDKKGFTAIHYSAKTNKEILIFEMLLNQKCEFKKLSYNGESILHSAAVNKNANIIKYIFDKSLCNDVNIQDGNGNTALHSVLSVGTSSEIVEILIKNGCQQTILNRNNSTILHAAANNYESKDTMVKLLVEKYNFEDVMKKNSYGDTAIHTAARSNNVSAFKYLFRLGLDPFDKNSDGKSSLELFDVKFRDEIDHFLKEKLFL